ncbi:MAG: hypothetical protein KGZ59_12645 [Chitinophagaceae bacterium]|nr:hypothetical protein [Chitinophagaceae bacterium]
MKQKLLLIYLTVILVYNGYTQEFTAFGLFGKGKSMKLTGGLNSTMMLNSSSDGSGGNRVPFTMIVGGNLNLFFKGYNVPISFTYSNAQVTVTPPVFFNKFSISPTYKWATLHLGTSSMEFSNYSLTGHQFDGVGVELAPGKFKIKSLYGRFLRGSGDYLVSNAAPSYNRKGYGFAFDYDIEKFKVGVSLFRASDDAVSASNIPFELNIQPKENVVSTISSSFSPIKDLKISAEYATSFLTQDVNSIVTSKIKNGIFGGMIKTNGSTTKNHAANIKANYTLNSIDLGLEYEKIDLNYRCLGAYYNQNGFENILLKLSLPLFNNKLFLAPSFGKQNDLVDTVFSQKSSRFITSINATYTPAPKWSIAGAFSNNSAVTNYRNLDNIANSNNIVPYYLDSLQLILLNLNANLNVNYQLKSTSDIQQTISASYSLQKSTKKEGDYFINEEDNIFHNSNIMLSTNYPQSKVQWTIGYNYNLNTIGLTNKTTANGVNFSFGKKLFKNKVNSVLSSSYNSTFNTSTLMRINITNLRFNISYLYKKKHDFKLIGIIQFRATDDPIKQLNQSVTNTIFSLNYNYSF